MADTVFEAAAAPVLDASVEVPEDTSPSLDPPTAPEPEVEPPLVPRGLYLVRVPKPPMDDTHLKQLQTKFQAQITKLKAMNGKLQAQREVVRGLRNDMDVVRGIKATSQPEFQTKYGRMKELRQLRDSYIGRIQDIKASIKGIECKSEEELESKIRELENRIAYEGLPLREEKAVVQQIAKLNSQRGKIKEYEGHKDSLQELEAEVQKVKALISGMEGEFSVIKTEHDATKETVQRISAQLAAAKEDLQKLDKEHETLVGEKEETLRQLDATRDQTNADMQDYRDYRKLSLTARDLVDSGRAAEAAPLVAEQVNEWIAKLSGDAEARQEYVSLWSAQRRYLVSELLPESSAQAAAEAAARAASTSASKAGPGGKGGKAGARAPPPPPRGEEKAKSIIEKLMQEASAEAAAAKARNAAVNGASDEDDLPPVPAPKAKAAPAAATEPYRPPAAPAAPAAPAKLVEDPAAAAKAAFNYKVTLPNVQNQEEFVVPPAIKDSVATETLSKEALREEQARKAAEAEERKRRRAEQAERKRVQAAETARKLEQERRERDAEARAAAAAKAAQEAQEAAAASEVAAASTLGAPGQDRKGADRAVATTEQQPVKRGGPVKRPRTKTPLRQVKSIWSQYQGPLVFGVVILLLAILLAIYLSN